MYIRLFGHEKLRVKSYMIGVTIYKCDICKKTFILDAGNRFCEDENNDNP